jgi:RimJ/RimL family protein N-acetyltransferase
MDIKIIGKKINLRLIHKADAASICRHARDKDISRYTFIPYPYRLENALKFIRDTHKQRRKGNILTFGIECKETGEIIGMISLMRIDNVNHSGEVGYWLGKKFWGKGFMLEAVQLICGHGFKKIKMVRIYARVLHPNLASARVLEKAGFRYEGRLRKTTLRYGRWLDDLRYGILKEEFKSAS